MLIYNTTYQTGIDDARNFVIWLSESYIPEVEKTGILQNPRLTHILSHKEQDSECFSLQWEVEDTATLHRWHTQQGMHLNEEMMKSWDSLRYSSIILLVISTPPLPATFSCSYRRFSSATLRALIVFGN